MAEILILYSTIDGHTRRICERLRELIEQSGHRVTLASLHEQRPLDVGSFDKVVIGASVRYGAHHEQVSRFVADHAAALRALPTAFFSVCAVARKPQRRDPANNRYLQEFLQRSSWQPDALAVFAGKIDYPRYGTWDRLVIRIIMKLTGGPTDPRGTFEFTDWAQVDAFAQRISVL